MNLKHNAYNIFTPTTTVAAAPIYNYYILLYNCTVEIKYYICYIFASIAVNIDINFLEIRAVSASEPAGVPFRLLFFTVTYYYRARVEKNQNIL